MIGTRTTARSAVAAVMVGWLGASAVTAQTPSAVVRVGAVYSTAQSASQSFLRFTNTSSAAGTVAVTLRDPATGQAYGQWTSPGIPAGAEIQYPIGVIEAGAGVPSARPDTYAASVQAGFQGYLQHVLYRPSDGTLTNLTTCDSGTTADQTRLSGVHTAQLGAGFPSSVVVNNTGPEASAATLTIYDARDGVRLGAYTTPAVAAGGHLTISVAAIEAAAQIPASAGRFHYVIRANPGLPGFLQHLVSNVQAGVVTDMTTQCALNATVSSTPLPAARIGSVYSTANASLQSFLRFFNTGLALAPAVVVLRDPATGQTLGQWSTPQIPPGGELQFPISAIETGTGQTFAKPATYSVEVRSGFSGYLQHVLYRPADGTLTNLSTCESGTTADRLRLAAVHSSRLASGFPSALVINNTGSTALAAVIGIHDARDGSRLGSTVTPAVAAGGQIVMPMSAIEAATGVAPLADQTHWVIRVENAFPGFLQHLVTNVQAGVVTDMTAACATAIAPAAIVASYYVAPNGSDTATGTQPLPSTAGDNSGPFRTIARAKSAMRALTKTGLGQVIVSIRAGTYHLSDSLLFIAADSGTADTRVTYRNHPGEQVSVSGGMRVRNWTNVGGNVWRTTLPDSTVAFENLYYNGARRLRPRLGGALGTYYRVGEQVFVPGDAPPAAAPDARCPTYVANQGWLCFDRFKYKSGDPITSVWRNLSPTPVNRCNQSPGNSALFGDIAVLAFERASAAKMRVECVDTVSRTVYLTGATGAPSFEADVSGFSVDRRYIVENVQDALTQPGQWFLDRSARPWTLSYLAHPAEDPNVDTVIVPQLTHVMRTLGVQFMTFQGLSFEHDNYVVPSAGEPGDNTLRTVTPAVSVQNSRNVTFDSVKVAHTAGNGLDVQLCIEGAPGNAPWCAGFAPNGVEQVADNLVQNSAFFDIGASAIGVGYVQRLADSDITVPQRVTVQNNVIAGYGRVLPHAFGVLQGNAHDITYTRNDIFDGYRAGISICPCNDAGKGSQSRGAFNTVISFNHVYNVMQGVMNDGGAIRLVTGGATYQAAGNRVINNRIHDIFDASAVDADGFGGDGISLGDRTSFIDIQNNLVYRVSRAAVNIDSNAHAANFPTTIRNNIFAFARASMINSGRPYPNGTVPDPAIQVFTASNNIFYFTRRDTSAPAFYVQGGCTYAGGVPHAAFQQRGNNIYWRTDGSFATDSRAFRVQPVAGPAGANTICNSALPGTHTFLTFTAWQSLNQDLGSAVQNPGFANPAYPADDYALPNGTPGAGFVVFDPTQSGRTNPTFTPPPVAATFPTASFDPATGF
jgi:hypothetical protein